MVLVSWKHPASFPRHHFPHPSHLTSRSNLAIAKRVSSTCDGVLVRLATLRCSGGGTDGGCGNVKLLQIAQPDTQSMYEATNRGCARKNDPNVPDAGDQQYQTESTRAPALLGRKLPGPRVMACNSSCRTDLLPSATTCNEPFFQLLHTHPRMSRCDAYSWM